MGIVGSAVLGIGVFAYTSQKSFQKTVNDELSERIKIYRDTKRPENNDIQFAFDNLQRGVSIYDPPSSIQYTVPSCFPSKVCLH